MNFRILKKRLPKYAAIGLITYGLYASFKKYELLGCSSDNIKTNFDFKSTANTLYSDKPFGYDIFFKDVKKYKYFDRRKMRFHFRSREEHIKELMDNTEKYDFLIIGSNVQGSQILRELSMRGLTCAIIDKGDFGQIETDKFLELNKNKAKYLLNSITIMQEGCLIPHYTKNIFEYMNKFAPYMKSYTTFYKKNIETSNIDSEGNSLIKITIPDPISEFPNQPYFNQKTKICNISRLIIQTLQTSSLTSFAACLRGATLGNYVEIIGLINDKETGKIKGAVLHDLISDQKFTLNTRSIIDCREEIPKEMPEKYIYSEGKYSIKFKKTPIFESRTKLLERITDFINNEISRKFTDWISKKISKFNKKYELKDDAGVLKLDKNDFSYDKIIEHYPELEPVYRISIANKTKLIGMYTNKSFDPGQNPDIKFIPAFIKILHKRYKLDKDICQHLINCYGSQSTEVIKLGQEFKLNKRLHPSFPVIKSQIYFAIKFEYAVHVDDILLRRLGIYIGNKKHAYELVDKIAKIMAKRLNWTEQQKNNEILRAKQIVNSLP